MKPRETTQIHLMTDEIRGVRYGVGRCVVTIGGAPIDGVAVAAGDERRVTTEDHAWAWLAQHGLTEDEARQFVSEGLREFDAFDEAYAD